MTTLIAQPATTAAPHPEWCRTHDHENDVCLGPTIHLDYTGENRPGWLTNWASVGMGYAPDEGVDMFVDLPGMGAAYMTPAGRRAMTILDTTIPAGLDQDGMTANERRQYELLKAHRALGLLIQRIPINTPWWRWSVVRDSVSFDKFAVEGHLGTVPNGHASRAIVMGIAEQFGFEYAEKPHGDGKNIITATGIHADVNVKVFDLVAPCACGCGGAK